MPKVSLKLVTEPLGVMVKPVALVSVSQTVPSVLRNVRWKGVLETSTRNPGSCDGQRTSINDGDPEETPDS